MVPLVFVIFNRPELTERVFRSIRRAEPSQLILVADGPRPEEPLDEELCERTRAVVSRVEWDCDVFRDYSKTNLGVGLRISSGLDFAFSKVDRAIVLEDDCIPNQDFFRYGQEMLARYEHDTRVGSVTGDNFQDGRRRGSASYYFSRYTHVWGWATWRRAWSAYDPTMAFLPELRESELWNDRMTAAERRYWNRIFTRVVRGEIDSWAYPWLATCFHNDWLTATPNVNLVTNLGFGEGATHTSDPSDSARVPSGSLGELTHPTSVVADQEADLYTFRNHFLRRRLIQRAISRISQMMQPRTRIEQETPQSDRERPKLED